MTQYVFPDSGTAESIDQLPDPFMRADGSRVTDPAEWPEQREYLKQMLAHYFYGTQPEYINDTVGTVTEQNLLFDDQVIEEQVLISFGPNQCYSFHARIYRPNMPGSFPAITYNLPTLPYWMSHRFVRETVVERHYIQAEFNREELASDNHNFFNSPLCKDNPECTWGALALWSWGHRRLADYLQEQDYCNPDQLVATGQSRGGKTALCAGIYDERFAVTAPSGSGCGGAGCLRYFGSRLGQNTGFVENIGLMMAHVPYWCAPLFTEFGQKYPPLFLDRDYEYALRHPEIPLLHREMHLPFDLHTAKALIAPRGLIDLEGLSDDWANPYGTQVTWRAADEVFQFLGAYGKNALHFRTGGHDYNTYDLKALLDYCDALFFGKPFSAELIRIPPPKEQQVSYCAYPADSPEAAFVRDNMEISYQKFHFDWSKP